MKVVFLKKKSLYYFFIFSLLILLIIISISINSSNSVPTFNPLDNNSSIDINSDGIKDSFVISENESKFFINNKDLKLDNYIKDINYTSSFWLPKVFPFNLSRQSNSEIIFQYKNNSNNAAFSVLSYKQDFSVLYSDEKNIIGILDSSSGKTPRFFALDSSKGKSSIKSFMVINNEILDTSKEYNDIPSLSNILEFINLIEKNYEIEDIPDIFTENIPSRELGLLWNLNKDKYTYSFQDGFFIDNSYDNYGNITSLTFRFTFECFNKSITTDSKKEVVIYVTSENNYNGEYKISSIFTTN